MTIRRKDSLHSPIIKYLTFTAIAFFSYFLLYGLFLGLKNPIPAPGDSYDYHIPIQKMIFDGSFIHPVHVKLPQWYYPGSTEALNAIFLELHIPLTLSNIAAILFLELMLWKLCSRILQDYYLSLLVSLIIVSQHAIIRWMNAVSIDVWMAGFFAYLLYLLLGRMVDDRDYLFLGIASGMVLGSKYPSVGIICLVGLLFGKRILSLISLKKFLFFIIPFSLLGLFWYMRNFLVVGNPVYPLPLLNLPSKPLFRDNIITELLRNPLLMFDAFIAEYKLYALILLGTIVYGSWQIISRKIKQTTLFILGVLLLVLFFFYPTSSQPWIMVSSFRYSYPFVICLLCWFFWEFRDHKLLPYILSISLFNMSVVSSFSYFPKLLFAAAFLAGVLFLVLEKRKNEIRRYFLR